MSSYKRLRNWASFLLLASTILLAWPTGVVHCEGENAFIGSQACRDCHETEYESFTKYAKKAHSYDSILAMKKGLTDSEFRSCFECHTTGYGKPGGFRSEAETPEMKEAGCEVCHGPGSAHAESEDPEDIKGSLSAKDCEHCHNAERVAAFDYKPLVYGGAH
jgi:hypothetical protein